MTQLRSVFRTSQRALRFAGMIALLGLVLVTAADVIGRVLFDSPLGFAYELIGILLGIGVYAGLIGMAWQRDHIRIDLLANQFNRFWHFEQWRDRFSWILELGFLAILAIFMTRQAMMIFAYKETFMFLPMNKWQPLALFSALAALAVVACLVAGSRQYRGKQEDLL